jgi:hypothetical protein
MVILNITISLPSSSISFAKFSPVAACIEFHCCRRQAIRHSTRDMKIRRSREPGSGVSHELCSQFRIICCCAFCISFKFRVQYYIITCPFLN